MSACRAPTSTSASVAETPSTVDPPRSQRRSMMAFPQGLLDRERPPREGGTGLSVPTLPDARTGHRNRGVAPSHGLQARYGIDESGGRGLTAKPPATCGVCRVSRPRADFVSGDPPHQIHMSRSATGQPDSPIRTACAGAAPTARCPPGATVPGRTPEEPDSGVPPAARARPGCRRTPLGPASRPRCGEHP